VKNFPLYQQKNNTKQHDKKGKDCAKTTKKGKCFNCQKEGHYAKQCPEPKKAQIDVKTTEVEVLISAVEDEGIIITDSEITTSDPEDSPSSESSDEQESTEEHGLESDGPPESLVQGVDLSVVTVDEDPYKFNLETVRLRFQQERAWS
jgi:hypothetical protein